MKIGMVLERDFPTTPRDIRVEKEVRSLLRAGHEVDLLSLKINSTKDSENIDGLNIFRVPIQMLCVRDWNKKRVERHFHSKTSPWVGTIERFIEQSKVEALHVHDLPLVWTATKAADQWNVPVVFDMHEAYPPMVRFMRPVNNGGWDLAAWVDDFEIECLHMVDKVIVVIEESKQRLIEMGIPKEKIHVVMNTEDPAKMVSGSKSELKYRHLEGKFIVTYVGTFGEIRGLENLIRSLPLVKPVIGNIHLLLVGGSYNQPQLEKLAKDLCVQDRVTITGWVDFSEVPKLIAISEICAVPHVKNAFTDVTIPHKLFQYMLMGKPIIVSDAKPLKRIIDECNCGRIFPSDDFKQLANLILGLAQSKDEKTKLGKNAQHAALTKYNWRNEEMNLMNLYELLS